MTRAVSVGKIIIGGGNPIVIQSMTKTDTKDIPATISQINELEKAGCELVRVAVPDIESAKAIKDIKRNISIPLVADIHFDYKLAIAAIEYGADKIRINPGNIGSAEKVKEVVKAAKERNIPIRVGVNSGSIRRDILERFGGSVAQAMVESAREEIRILEDMGFFDIVVSLKATDVKRTIEANRIFAQEFDYPVHLGITASGLPIVGAIHSAIGIYALLNEGIGDTIRVSLTGEPVLEIITAKEILRAAGKRDELIRIISCPTCGRRAIDVIRITEEITKRVGNIKGKLTVAIMGCEVNGPGEAKEADIGIAGTRNGAVLFSKGKAIGFVKDKEILEILEREIRNLMGL